MASLSAADLKPLVLNKNMKKKNNNNTNIKSNNNDNKINNYDNNVNNNSLSLGCGPEVEQKSRTCEGCHRCREEEPGRYAEADAD